MSTELNFNPTMENNIHFLEPHDPLRKGHISQYCVKKYTPDRVQIQLKSVFVFFFPLCCTIVITLPVCGKRT